jgi:hypothetical protein
MHPRVTLMPTCLLISNCFMMFGLLTVALKQTQTSPQKCVSSRIDEQPRLGGIPHRLA